ncbi:MarR family transcriptional regulator [Burkholderia guangdongensis]|uniref:HVO_A0114 family putative DNA-binding protein n=1 Tax=Burkholderia guangdongensis TaxID=1792500 RepID=UPI0015C6C5BC|nr:MarR family transcriptional regulator [Burkholderia guangdongensis]
MSKIQVEIGTEADFFARGKRLAQQLDRREVPAKTHIVMFEDPADLALLLTQARIGVFRAIKEGAASVAVIAARLSRDRSVVNRDVDALCRAGLVTAAWLPV